MDMNTGWVWIAIAIAVAFVGIVVEMDDIQWDRHRG